MKPNINKRINWLVIGMVFLVACTIGAYIWSTTIISSLENYRSPINAVHSSPREKIGTPVTDRVILVILDSLRYDTSVDRKIMPYLNDLRDIGASAIMISQPPSFSAPGWVTILTGAWPEINDSQLMNPMDDYSARPLTQDDIFASADRQGLATAVSGYIWFDGMLSRSGIDKSFFTSGEDNAADQEVVANALSFLEQDYKLVLIHIDQIDYAGHHEGGPINSHWDEAATRSDKLIQLIGESMDFSKDTLILLSDHGQIDKGGHGGNDEVCLTEPFVVVGKSIIPGNYEEIKMVDVAPTIAVLLGTNIPASSQGRPLLEMLEISSTSRQNIEKLLLIQQSTLLATYTKSIGVDSNILHGKNNYQSLQEALTQARYGKLAKERIWRNLISVFLAFVPGYILFLRKEKNNQWIFFGCGIYILLFIFQYVIIAKNPFSLSWIPSVDEFILYVCLTTSIALIPSWLFTIILTKDVKGGVNKLINNIHGTSWLIIYLLLLPFLLYFTLYGIKITWTLPNFSILFLAFISVVQILFVSIFSFVIIGIISFIGIIKNHKYAKIRAW